MIEGVMWDNRVEKPGTNRGRVSNVVLPKTLFTKDYVYVDREQSGGIFKNEARSSMNTAESDWKNQETSFQGYCVAAAGVEGEQRNQEGHTVESNRSEAPDLESSSQPCEFSECWQSWFNGQPLNQGLMEDRR
jgi:hypothetical protein